MSALKLLGYGRTRIIVRHILPNVFSETFAYGVSDFTLVILTVALSAYIVLRASRRVLALLGDDGIASLKGIMGFLLVCIGVQFVANGVAEFVGIYSAP